MIPWWVAVVALVIGEVFGVLALRLCTMNEPEEHKSKYIR